MATNVLDEATEQDATDVKMAKEYLLLKVMEMITLYTGK